MRRRRRHIAASMGREGGPRCDVRRTSAGRSVAWCRAVGCLPDAWFRLLSPACGPELSLLDARFA